MTKYTEIFKLKKMLEEAKIPFAFLDRRSCFSTAYQIAYPKPKTCYTFKCSVIQGDYSYGGKENLLEIMGLLTKKERKQDDVLGFLTAEEVFERIKEDWKNENQRI